MNVKFTAAQRRIFIACFLSYACAYIGRLNLSAALNSVIGDMNLTDAQGGLFQTVFALTYAAGQLVNGSIVDKISARVYIFLGLALSGVCNLLFGLASSYWMMTALWALNGAAQSMLWTPIVKLMAVWFKGRRRGRASFGLSMTLVLGNLSAWALSGCMASLVGWRFSFIIPAAITAAMGVGALFMLSDAPKSGELPLDDEAEENVRASENGEKKAVMPLKEMFLGTGFIAVLACCVCNGFVRDGIITWAPTIIVHSGGGQAVNSTLLSLIIPMLNLAGVLMAQRFYHIFGDNARRCAGCLMAICAGLALLLRPASLTMATCALTLGLCCAATYGINPMLTTLIPMEYEPVGRVGLTAGLVDCFIYLGSSLAGVLTGAISDAAGWTVVFLLWMAVAACSAALAFYSMRGGKRLRGEGSRA
ncbi:MAG: MFS transporter [Clostridiales bacterium]|nr:MFS transporter [Clostridiales bacterium]